MWSGGVLESQIQPLNTNLEDTFLKASLKINHIKHHLKIYLQNAALHNFGQLSVSFLIIVEEVLVCVDGSQPQILQGLHCRGGEFSRFFVVLLISWFFIMSSSL